jgi:hypothetical protein
LIAADVGKEARCRITRTHNVQNAACSTLSGNMQTRHVQYSCCTQHTQCNMPRATCNIAVAGRWHYVSPAPPTGAIAACVSGGLRKIDVTLPCGLARTPTPPAAWWPGACEALSRFPQVFPGELHGRRRRSRWRRCLLARVLRANGRGARAAIVGTRLRVDAPKWERALGRMRASGNAVCS